MVGTRGCGRCPGLCPYLGLWSVFRAMFGTRGHGPYPGSWLVPRAVVGFQGRGQRKTQPGQSLCVSPHPGEEDSGRAARVAGLGSNARNAAAVSPACPARDLAWIWGEQAGFTSFVNRASERLRIHVNNLRRREASASPRCARTSQPVGKPGVSFRWLGRAERGRTLSQAGQPARMPQRSPGEGLPAPSRCRGALLTDRDPVSATGLGNKTKHRCRQPSREGPNTGTGPVPPAIAGRGKPRTSPRHHGARQSQAAKRKQRLRGSGAGMCTAALGEEPSLPLPGKEEEEEGAFLPFSRLMTPQPIRQVIYS